MQKRNWLDLARKLVDRYDMDFTVTAIQASLGEYALNYFGFGVLKTTMYPTPFPITMSGLVLGGTVGNGIGFDPNGFITRIDTASPTSKDFTISTAAPALPRWDLLVIRYKATGDTPVPKPSDPILTVDLNIHDDFELMVIPGTASVTPAYPAKGSLDIILAGLRVPAGATIGTQVTVDLVPRENAQNNFVEFPVFKQELLAGLINNVNQDFELSEDPFNASSVLVYLNDLLLEETEYSFSGTTVTLNDPPAPGQKVYAWYVVLAQTSQNPLSGLQEKPAGAVDGVNDTYQLAGSPGNQDSMMVWVDGILAENTEWSLLQGPISYVVFDGGSIPQPGQSVYCFYMVNALVSGAAPPPVPGGSGGFVTYGTPGAAIAVNPAAGFAISADQRQMRFVRSIAGQQTITANPQIAPGTILGQELEIVGTSDTNYSTLNDGNGVALNGAIDLKQHKVIQLAWDGAVWFERGRQ